MSKVTHYQLTDEQLTKLQDLFGDPEAILEPYKFKGHIYVVIDETIDRPLELFNKKFQKELLNIISINTEK